MRIHRKSVLLFAILSLAALACNLPVSEPDEFPPPPATITAPVDAGAESQPATETVASTPQSPGETPTPTIDPLGGFVTGTVVDPATLPDLQYPVAGLGPVFCDSTATAPGIAITPMIDAYQVLCLLNFPTAADSQPVTITLTDPMGNTFVEVFTYKESEPGSVTLVNSRGEDAGYAIVNGGGFASADTASQLILTLYTPAHTITGTWTAAAQTQDGSVSVPETPISIDYSGPFVSVTTDEFPNPWRRPNTQFKTGDVVFVFGAKYAPGTALAIAFYWSDESATNPNTGLTLLRPKYATRVTADGQGLFRAEFHVGNQTARGDYFTVALPQITPDALPNPFTGTFTIN